MARRRSKHPYGQGHIPLSMDRLASVSRTQTGPGGTDFTVQHLRGGDKSCTCLGCHRVAPAGTVHVVAWSNESLFGTDRGLEERRHQHTSCWERRLWQDPTPERSSKAENQVIRVARGSSPPSPAAGGLARSAAA